MEPNEAKTTMDNLIEREWQAWINGTTVEDLKSALLWGRKYVLMESVLVEIEDEIQRRKAQ